MHGLYRSIDLLNGFIGKVVSWFTLLMVLIQFWLVLSRYLFSLNSLYSQESIVYLHGFAIMLGAAYTWLHNGHVRVDIFFRDSSEKNKNFIDLLGSIIFVIPFASLLIWAAWPDIYLSWSQGEGSTETSGIPYKSWLKSSVIVFSVLLILQAFSTMIKCSLRLAGSQVYDPYRNEEGDN